MHKCSCMYLHACIHTTHRYTHRHTQRYLHRNTHTQTAFSLFCYFIETKAFRTSWRSPFSIDDWKCPVSVTVIQHTYIQHLTRNVSFDSSCQGSNIACNCSQLGFQFPATCRNINKVNSFIYSGSGTSLLWEYMRIQSLKTIDLEMELK